MSELLNPGRSSEPSRPGPGVIGLFLISAASLWAAQLLMPAGYSPVANTTSESAAQGVEYAWIARLGFLAFGLAVLWLAAALRTTWARGAAMCHVAFGVLMIATAAFSHRSWVAGARFDAVEDLLHSITATAMGFAFSFGVLARLLQRGRQEEPGRAFDVVALAAATLIPLLMTRFTGLDGVMQRLMFLVAYRSHRPLSGDMGFLAIVFSNGLVRDLAGHEGIMLSEGFDESESPEVEAGRLAHAVLVKANATGGEECRRMVEECWSQSGIPVERVEILTDDPARMRRRHRISFQAMDPGELVLHGTWLAYRREHPPAAEQARRIMRNAALRRPWEIWK